MPEFLKVMDDWGGYVPVGAHKISEAAQSRFLDLLSNKERRPAHQQEYLLREVITTSDFPALFGFTLEREMLARYRAVTADWQGYTKTGTLPNFNAAELHKVQGNDTLLPRVVEKGEYYVAPVVEGYYSRRLYKYGRQFDISWESLINDALGAFQDIPQRFADSVLYTRAYNVTDMIASAGGPDALLFGAALADVADGQLITNVGALPLTIGNLQVTLGLMAAQTDVNGRPLGIRGKHLVVPPALEFTARAILTSALMAYAATAAGAVPLPTVNVVSQLGLVLHVDPLLPVIDVSGNRNGTWYLFADLADGRAIQMDFLRGYEDPEICMKASDKVAVGGGPISPFDGDFATDNVFYRVRDVHGGTRVDRRYCYAQVSA
jgi:hypothetical protein